VMDWWAVMSNRRPRPDSGVSVPPGHWGQYDGDVFVGPGCGLLHHVEPVETPILTRERVLASGCSPG